MNESEFVVPPYEKWDDAQPYPMWARARAICPIIETEGNEWAPGPTFSTTTFADADRVLRDSTTFSSSINSEAMAPFMGELLLGLDGEEHRRYQIGRAHV